MAKLVLPVQIEGVDVLIEATPIAGTEPTSKSDPTTKIRDTFAKANEVIASVAKSTVDALDLLGEAARPEQFAVEFGISFSAKGNIIVAGAESGATLKVTLTYNSSKHSLPAE